MSFMRKAQEAAEAARARVEEAASSATRTAADPTTQDKINQSLAGASKGAREAVEKAGGSIEVIVPKDPAELAAAKKGTAKAKAKAKA